MMEQLDLGNESHTPDGLTPKQVLEQISQTAHAAIERQYRILNEEILPNPKYYQEHQNDRRIQIRKKMIRKYMRYSQIPQSAEISSEAQIILGFFYENVTKLKHTYEYTNNVLKSWVDYEYGGTDSFRAS